MSAETSFSIYCSEVLKVYPNPLLTVLHWIHENHSNYITCINSFWKSLLVVNLIYSARLIVFSIKSLFSMDVGLVSHPSRQHCQLDGSVSGEYLETCLYRWHLAHQYKCTRTVISKSGFGSCNSQFSQVYIPNSMLATRLLIRRK